MLTRVNSKPSRNRCPLCHGGLEEEPFRCDGCETEYHSECVTEFGGCGTLGCARAGVAPEEDFSERLARWRRERARRRQEVDAKLAGVRAHTEQRKESIRRRRVEIEQQRQFYEGRKRRQGKLAPPRTPAYWRTQGLIAVALGFLFLSAAVVCALIELGEGTYYCGLYGVLSMVGAWSYYRRAETMESQAPDE